MRKISEPGRNCKRISKWCFSNFNASPLTEKKSPWIYWGLSIFFNLYNLVHFYPLKGDNIVNIFSSQVPNIIKSVQYLTMRCLLYILMQLVRGKRFTVCTEITIILGTVRFTIRGGRLRYKRYDNSFFEKKVVSIFRFLLLVII
jgi:hypothetical protein